MKTGFQSAGFLNYSPRDAMKMASTGAVLVDVREKIFTGYKRFDYPRIIYIPNSELSERYHELPVDKTLIVADSVGLRSREAMIFLKEKGFTNLANLAGGIVEWEKDGLPLVTDESERLDGSCMCQLRPRTK
jgi:rhodanese-related sulfurtransferase